MGFVRVKLVARNQDWEHCPIVVDLKVQQIDGLMRAVGDSPRFGAMGVQATDYYWPFRLDSSGNVDFGSDVGARSGRLNLLEREIRPNRDCTYRDDPNAQEVTYTIREITPL